MFLICDISTIYKCENSDVPNKDVAVFMNRYAFLMY